MARNTGKKCKYYRTEKKKSRQNKTKMTGDKDRTTQSVKNTSLNMAWHGDRKNKQTKREEIPENETGEQNQSNVITEWENQEEIKQTSTQKEQAFKIKWEMQHEPET